MQPRKRNQLNYHQWTAIHKLLRKQINNSNCSLSQKGKKLKKTKLPSTTHCQGLYRILFTNTIYMLIASQTFTVHSPPQQFPRRAMSSKITSQIATQQDYQANVSGQP